MNKVILIGRLTKDPVVRYSQGANPTAVARFTLAVERRFKSDNQDADFIGCISFGKNAEFIGKYFTKGMKIAVVGRIQTSSYTNNDGQKVYTTDVVIEENYFVESKSNSSNNQSNSAPEPSSSMGDGFMNIPNGIDDELPFN